MIFLGFDYGEKRIGVAVGQQVTWTARPLTTLVARHNGQVPWAEIAALIETWQPDACVVGLPLTLAGEPQAVTEKAERFARQLHGRFQIVVHLMDERLTSRIAEQSQKEAGRKTGRKSVHGLDSEAAALILQAWLSEQSVQ